MAATHLVDDMSVRVRVKAAAAGMRVPAAAAAGVPAAAGVGVPASTSCCAASCCAAACCAATCCAAASNIVMGHHHVGGATRTGTVVDKAGAAQILMGTAPGLLGGRPASVPVRQAFVAGIGLADDHSTTSTGGLPGPVPVNEDFLPHHACASIAIGRGIHRLAAQFLTVAAPDLLVGRPGAAPVAQGGLAVEGLGAGALHPAAGRLDAARAAHVAFHLDLAVGEVAGVALSGERVFLRPLDALLASAGLAVQRAGRLAAQRGQSRCRAAQLEVAAAEVALVLGPGVQITRILAVAVVLHTELVVVVLTAEVLLVGRPALLPVGDASSAVIAAVADVDTVLHVDDCMCVPVAVPASWAAPVLMVAAPALLRVRPAMVPVGEASITVIVCRVDHMHLLDPAASAAHVVMTAAPALLRVRPDAVPVVHATVAIKAHGAAHVVVRAAPALLLGRPSAVPVVHAAVAIIALILDRVPNSVVVRDNVRRRRHRHGHVVGVAWYWHRDLLLHGDHRGRLRHGVGHVHRHLDVVIHGGARHVHMHVLRRAGHVVVVHHVVDDRMV
mmetsp:Transcript_74079/g.176672  ORF Transcript_74079/g.176672 Transcript_74079/m.176672 type:complete len:558 (-) Transcript_74079:944-2617(-)